VSPDHGRVERIALDICYPDKSLKYATWGTTWADKTVALIFSQSEMADEQKSQFRGGRMRWTKSAWNFRPTLIRQTVDGLFEPICSVREFKNWIQPNNRDQKCISHVQDRGSVLRANFLISFAGATYVTNLHGKSMLNTSAIVFNRAAMTDLENECFDSQPNAVAIRRQNPSTIKARPEFELLSYDLVPATDVETSGRRVYCGGEGLINEVH
jgi:hypothetical protein